MPKGIYSRPSLEERFYNKVNKTDSCWIWTAYRSNFGYGTIGIEKKTCKAHRVAWELEYGTIPKDMQVCHSCDNPSCVRPSHLFIGSQQDNIDDQMKKKRHVSFKGSDNGMSRLSEEDVRSIHDGDSKGISHNKIAQYHGVSRHHVSQIIRGKRWVHLGLGSDASHDFRGENNGRAKLTEKNVLQIRIMYKNGYSRKTLMKEFGIGSSNLCNILSGKAWRHLGE